MKIAIIGSGIGGLAAAWHLGQRYQVTLYEKQAQLGMSAHGLDWGGARVDMPLRVLYRGYYPYLMRLYAEAGIDTVAADYSAAFCDPDGRSYFRYRNWRPWARHSIPVLQGGRPLSRVSRQICIDLGRFYLGAARDRRRLRNSRITLQEYLERKRFSTAFVDRFLLPTFAAISTCDYASVLQYPAAIIVDYLTRGVLLEGVRRTVRGADFVTAQLSRHCADIRLSATITGLDDRNGRLQIQTSDGSVDEFEHVVLATQANQARQLVADCDPAALAALQHFPYEPGEVVVHTDARLMPTRRRDWSPVNFFVDPDEPRPMATIWLNAVLPVGTSAGPAFQTWQPLRQPDPAQVLARARFERPVVNERSQTGLAMLQRLQQNPERRIWYCGSYATTGVPLLESAARSAHTVHQALQRVVARG